MCRCRSGVAPFVFALGSLLPMCGPSPPQQPDVPGGTITVNGTEHLEWDQSSVDGQFPDYEYVAYVDNLRRPLPTTCQPAESDANAAHCRAPLPQMTAGSHRLELATVRTFLGIDYESPRSAPLELLVSPTSLSVQPGKVSSEAAGGPAAEAHASATSQEVTARDGARVTVETLATTLAMPSAIAPLPDGRVLIAEASGAIRLWDGRVLAAEPVVRLRDVARRADIGLIGVTPHPEFARNHELFVVYTAREQDGGLVNRVARFRESAGVLRDGIVLLEDRIAELPQRTPRIRFGPDQKLYVAFPAGRDRRDAEDPALYVGKILRLNEDGTTPADNPGFTPVISTGGRSPEAFDWQPLTGELWLAERDWSGRDSLRIGARLRRTAFEFDSAIDASAAVFFQGTVLPTFEGNLLIAGLDGRQLRRVQFDHSDPHQVIATESLLGDQFGRIADVVEGPDGAIYFCTSNDVSRARGGFDQLIRVRAASASR